MGDLIRAGKIRGFGVSNFRGWRIAEIARLCEKNNVPLPLVCQPYYNLLNRMPEVEILPACANYGLGVVPYSPIARGVKLGQFATAWVLANSAISSVIAGPRTLAQMEDYYDAVELKISAEEEALIDGLVTPGHSSTPGYNDPSYPFFGRVAVK